jgi:hypothetical protein
MQHTHRRTDRGTDLESPVRNNYFYGQLLGVENFELETGYSIAQRRLLNRVVLGYGVVCGLGVRVLSGGRRIAISAGVALDRWGREIIVPRETDPIDIPDGVIQSALTRADECDEEACIQVVLCYHECLGDPVPAMAGDCQTVDPCAPSTIRERYRVRFRDRCDRCDDESGGRSRVVSGGRIDHQRLAWWVTDRDCSRLPRDPCIPLANLRIDRPDDDDARCDREAVDIGVRPIVWSNLLLKELLTAALDSDEYRYHEE